ncbi:MAG: phosphatidylglycerol lysyltransferase, partial [Actinomycetota bacterium]|nr:phosphatidylglycerol lysyltransferase [Actinomycetota bacterium]
MPPTDPVPTAPPRARPPGQGKPPTARVTVAFIAAFWAAGALSSSLVAGPVGPLQPNVALTVHSLPDHGWALLASPLWAQNLGGYVWGTALVLTVGLPLERRMGSLKFTIAALGAQMLGAGAALGFLAVARGTMGIRTEE